MHPIINKNKYGFTLFETLIYIALLSVIISGALITVYGLIDGSQKINTRTIIQEEGNFVSHKIGLVIEKAANISTPSFGSPHSNTLIATLHDGSVVAIQLNTIGHSIEMQRDSGPFVPLTSANVNVGNLNFDYLLDSPAGISASTTINGFVFEISKHKRY